MKHSEVQYISLGFKFEHLQSSGTGQAAAQAIRTLMESEVVEDRAEARYLVERGRQEYRQGVVA